MGPISGGISKAPSSIAMMSNIQSPNGLGGSFSGFTLFVGKVVGGAWMTVGQEEVLCPMHPHSK